MSRSKPIILILLLVCLVSLAGVAQADGPATGTTCYQPTRLVSGQQGRVTTYPNLPNRIRTNHSFTDAVLGYIPAGATFTVVGGPVCDWYVWWWQVSYNGITGWTAEGDGGYTYWLEPVNYTPPPACALPTRLGIGGQGRVLPGTPNVVRSAPGTQSTGAYSTVIGTIPGGGVFSVLDGPQCGSDGRWWWRVNYGGLIGWTAEGEGYNSYWIEPVVNTPPPACALPNRLAVFGVGRVIPGDANVVRSAPGTQSTGANSVVIGSIPGGGVFAVSGGPVCGSDGRWWWYVDYNGLIGWTAEGQGYNSYWVEPWSTSAPACPNFLPSRLSVGGYGRVNAVPYLPNNIRSSASFNSAILGQIPVGGVFQVLSGPLCQDNTAWWQVNYNGTVGWTVEGNGSSYWLEPY